MKKINKMILNSTNRVRVDTLEDLEKECCMIFQPNIPIYERKVNLKVENDKEYFLIQDIFKNLVKQQLNFNFNEEEIKFSNVFIPSIGKICLEEYKNL